MKTLPTLLACALALATIAATPAPSDRAFTARVFAPIAGELRTSGVPVLLPGAFSADDLKGVIAELRSSDASGYSIDLDYVRDCNGATACYLGNLSGSRAGATALHGEKVPLSGGTTAYFVDGPCGASCSDSTLSFDRNGYRYVFSAKGATKAYLAQWASSIVTLDQLSK